MSRDKIDFSDENLSIDEILTADEMLIIKCLRAMPKNECDKFVNNIKLSAYYEMKRRQNAEARLKFLNKRFTLSNAQQNK